MTGAPVVKFIFKVIVLSYRFSVSFFPFRFAMVILRDCDELGRVISPITKEEKRELWNQAIRHAKRPNGTIDLEILKTNYLGHPLFSNLSTSSDSDGGNNTDSDCVLLFSSSRSSHDRQSRPNFPMICGGSKGDRFANGVMRVESRYTDPQQVSFFRSKLHTSSTGNEADVVLEACRSGEKICLPHPQGIADKIFRLYVVVMEDMGVKFLFKDFEVDVLRCLNVAPSKLQFNSWAFIRGFEVLCEGLGFQPSLGVFLYFYETKGVDRLSWVTISAHPGKSLFATYAYNPKNLRDSYLRV